MATVKAYTGGVQQAGLPGVRATAALTPEAAGAGIGSAIEKTAQVYYRDEIDRQDQVAFLEADRKLSEWENKALYDPKDGALNKRGKDAFAVPELVDKDFETQREAIRASLSTDRQRIAFDRSADSRIKTIRSSLSKHVFQEARQFEEVETKNYIKNAGDSAILNHTDPERVQLELDRGTAAIADFARRNGLGAEYEKQARSQFISNTTVGIIDRFLSNGQDQIAREKFKEAKDRGLIAGDDITKIEARINVAEKEGEGLRGAASIWDAAGPKSDLDPVSLDTMYREAEKKYADNPGLLKAVKQGLAERAAVHNSSQRERSEANGNAVWGAIEGGANLTAITRMPEYRALPGKQRDEIKRHMVDRAEILRNRAEGKGDDALFYQLITEASSPDLADRFATRNLMEDRAKLSRAQFNQLIGIQASIRKGDTKETDKLLASERAQSQIVNDALLGLKLDPTPKETNAPMVEKVTAFRRAVRESVRALEARQGKNATDEQVQGIVDGLVIEGVTKKNSFFPDDKKRVYQLQPGESITIKPTDVPKAEKVKIEAALRANNMPITDQAIVQYYTAKLLKMRGTEAIK